MHYTYSDLAIYCMHTWQTFVLSVRVMFDTVWRKRLRFFRDSAADTRERLDIFLYHELGICLEDTTLASRKWMYYKCSLVSPPTLHTRKRSGVISI